MLHPVNEWKNTSEYVTGIQRCWVLFRNQEVCSTTGFPATSGPAPTLTWTRLQECTWNLPPPLRKFPLKCGTYTGEAADLIVIGTCAHIGGPNLPLAAKIRSRIRLPRQTFEGWYISPTRDLGRPFQCCSNPLGGPHLMVEVMFMPALLHFRQIRQVPGQLSSR